MTTGKTIALTRGTFVGKVMSLLFNILSRFAMGFPGGSIGKESTCNAGDLSSIPGSGKIPWVREDPLEKGMVNQSNILA